ncbi:TPA: phage scaffolding protein [Streptococcus suis]|uniref:phage scaffolding protein n=1 Tax=Streptococcus suis TaxID=1307 RepID=UPI00209A6D7F|nr:phage scaffolding protein [Streptococcus suis]MCO8207660.1 phage scaffolding protein [Streptococcus suis]MCO8212013.1 phage scaffolding protein [Streptococcus suis]HEM3492157.1 phage scaffolding protein [Streptococcus suis]HEM3494448.1 phage scaffolding protein [Streptococcus suis]
MAFTTEELLKLGLTEEQAKDVFALHGKDLNANKSALETITQERDSLKSQLQNTEAQLETLKADANTSAEQKEALDKLQAEYDKYKADAAAELAQTQKVNAINLALKDTKAHNPETLMKFIDVDVIELDDNGKPKLDEVINGLMESDPYLFKAEEESTPNPNIVPPGNPAANGTGNTDPFQAIMDNYGK